MRVLPEATAAEIRRRIGQEGSAPARRVEVVRRRRTANLIGALVGVLLALVYLRLMVKDSPWWIQVVMVCAGMVAGYLVVAIPGFILQFFRRTWYRLALSQYGDTARALAGRATHRLHSSAEEDFPPGQKANDLGVLATLREDWRHAGEGFREALASGEAPGAAVNLLAFAAETHDWDLFGHVLEQAVDSEGDAADNLTRAAAEITSTALLDRLWGLAGERRYHGVMNNLGVRMLRAGDLTAAEAAFKLALQQAPSYGPAHVNLGALRYRQQDWSDALAQTAFAVNLRSRDLATYSNVGVMLCRAGDSRSAHRWLRRALLAAPANPAAHLNMGNLLALEAKYEEALEEYQAAARMGDCPDAHHNAALIYFARGQLPAAREQQQKARACAPGDAEILNNDGCLRWHQGDYAGAEECFRAAAELRPSGPAVGNLIAAEIAAGRAQQALEMLKTASYDPVDMAFDRGLAHLLLGHQIDPAASETHRRLQESSLAQAALFLRQVADAGQGNQTEAWVDLGLAEYLSKDYGEAAEAFVTAARRSREFAGLQYPAAVCYLWGALQIQEQHGSEDMVPPAARELLLKARPLLEKAVETRELSEASAYNMGVVYYMLGDLEAAVAALRRAVAADARPQTLNALAIALARRAQELQKPLTTSTLLTEQKRQQILSEVRKQLSASIHYFEQVLRLQPHNPFVHANAGLAYMLRNQPQDVETALHHWQLMRQVGGDWGQRVFEVFTQAMASESAKRLHFQDLEIAFRELQLSDWVTAVPPRLAPLRYQVQEVLDLPQWRLVAYHRLTRRALAYRDRAQRLRAALQRMSF